MKSIYLGGPINGMPLSPVDYVRSWRKRFTDNLSSKYIIYDPTSDESWNHFPLRRRVCRDRFFVNQSDLVVMNFLSSSRTTWPIGSLIELGWADAARKPIVLITLDNAMIEHAFIQDICPWIVKSEPEAEEIICQILQ